MGSKRKIEEASPVEASNPKRKAWFGGMFGGTSESNGGLNETEAVGIARKRSEELSETEKSILDGYFVRIRYNDRVMNVPGCKPAGKHLDGDESFCTLVSQSFAFMFPTC